MQSSLRDPRGAVPDGRRVSSHFSDGDDGHQPVSSPVQNSSTTRSGTLGRWRSSRFSRSFGSQSQTTTPDSKASPVRFSSKVPRRRRSVASLSPRSSRYGEHHSRLAAANRARSDWNSAAREIETVIFGESDDDDDEREDDGISREARTNAIARGTRRPSRSKNLFGMGLGKWRRKSKIKPTTARLPSAPMTHMIYNLFDDQQMARPNNNAPSSRTTITQSSSPIIIYGQKYRNSPESLFRPVAMVLSATFVALLLVRIASNLLTSGLGMVVVMLLVGLFVLRAATQPIRLLKLLHSSPVLSWACVGAVLCSLGALGQTGLDRLLSLVSCLRGKLHETTTLSPEWTGIGCMAAGLGEIHINSDDESTYNDFVLFWGFISGLFYGVEVGCVWMLVFGDGSNPTRLTRFLLGRIWRPARRWHKKQMLRWHVASSLSSNCLTTSTRVDFLSLEQHEGLGHHRCAICLDCLDPAKDEQEERNQDLDKREGKIRRQCQLLPCLHCFHEDCVNHWLTIRLFCPVCRVPVVGMQPSIY